MGFPQHSKNLYLFFSFPSLFFSLSIPPHFFFSLWVAFGIQKKYTFQTLTSFLFSSAGCLPFFLTLSVVSAFFLTTFSCLPSFSHTLSVVSLFFIPQVSFSTHTHLFFFYSYVFSPIFFSHTYFSFNSPGFLPIFSHSFFFLFILLPPRFPLFF